MADVTLGYYVHHHGTGHLQRALQIIPHIPATVVMFSSAPQPDVLPANALYVQLDDDAVQGYEYPVDEAWMYTPLDAKVLGRYRQILDAVQKFNLRCMYVDVSMEVAMFCKIIGLRVGHNVMQGKRDDRAHDALYAMLDFYLADATPELDATSRRRPDMQVSFVGGISRYALQPPKQANNFTNILITVSPKSTNELPQKVGALAVAYPKLTWSIIGTPPVPTNANVTMHGFVKDPYDLYMAADVVIGAGGHNTIMEMASLGKHFVCIPEDRAFNEQACAAEALSQSGMAVTRPNFPAPADWPDIIAELKAVDIDRFQTLVNDNAARQAATIIAGHA